MVNKKLSPFARGTTLRTSNVCDDGNFSFPKECRACEAISLGGGYETSAKGFFVFLGSFYPCFLLQSNSLFLLYVLWRPKNQKPGTRAHQLSLPLFRNFPLGNILQTVRSLPLEPFVCFFGCCETRSVSCAWRT